MTDSPADAALDVDDTSLAAPVEYFRCAPYASLLRRSACGERYTRMNGTGKDAPVLEARIRDARCTACPVGKEHAAGGRHADAPRVPAPMLHAPRPPAAGVPARVQLQRDVGAMMLSGLTHRSLERSAAQRAGVAPPKRPPRAPPRAPLASMTAAAATTPKPAPTTTPATTAGPEERRSHARRAVTAPGSEVCAAPPRTSEPLSPAAPPNPPQALLAAPPAAPPDPVSAPPHPPETTMPISQTYRFKGHAATAVEWAALYEVTTKTVRARVQAGIPLDAPKIVGRSGHSFVGTWDYERDCAVSRPTTARTPTAQKSSPPPSPVARTASTTAPPITAPVPAWDPMAPTKLGPADVLRWLGYRVDELELPGDGDRLLRVREVAS